MSGNQRIAFLCHPYHRGGVTRWMADAALAFAENGHEVYFITVEPAKDFFSAKGRETLLQLLNKEDNAIHIITTKAGSEFEFGTRDYRAYIYRKLMLKLPPGTPVILSDDDTIWTAATLLHNTYPIVGVLHADDENYYTLAEKYFRQVSVFVCVSERVSRNVMQRVPQISEDTVFTIPCGINLPAAVNNGHDGNILQLVYIGRISEYQKRVSDLVKVCGLLHQRNVAFHLDIIGDGNDKTSLENKFKEARLEALVTFHGWQSQKKINEQLSVSDILILTSDFEGTPIAMMEALAAGCGIVGTRVSGIEDYELHPMAADCFAVFDVGYIEVAADKISKIAAIPVHVRQMAARKIAESEFSMDVCLDRYTRAIDTIKKTTVPAPMVTIPLMALLYSRVIATARYLKVSFKP